MDKLPTTKLQRTKIVAKATLKIGIKKSKGFIARNSKEQTQEEIGEVILQALNELKGVSVKIAQTLVLGMPFLDASYLDKISKTFDSVTPINRALIRKIIKQELGFYPEDIFEEFDLKAYASASLGQVHKAKYQGKELAIKVQYPGISTSIDSDMTLIKFALKRFSKGADIEHIVEELHDRLNEELDYICEANNAKKFLDANCNSDIVIPKVIDELTTKKVLASEFLNGLSFKEFLASNPSQKQRDRYAQLIFDNFFDTLYTIKTIHADPNPGNFLFLKDGKLGIIDFGCTKVVNEEFLKSFNKLHLSLIDGIDDLEIAKQYMELGMIDPASNEEMLKFYKEIINPLDTIYIEIFKQDRYNFRDSNYAKRGFDAIFTVQKRQATSVQNYNKDYIFIDRTLLGYYAMFERMGATIDTTYVKELMGRYDKEIKS